MCDRSHTYTVEVVGETPRYIGTDEDEAVGALLSINPDHGEEGYVVAEHTADGAVIYCPAESNRLENEAIKARDHMETQWAAAHEAFHGEGPYAIGNQG